MQKTDHIFSVLTTKKEEEWGTLKPKIQELFNKDISKFMPIFLTLDDFKITHDPDFKPWSIISSWWQYKKIPVIIISGLDDIKNMDEKSRILIESSSVFIV